MSGNGLTAPGHSSWATTPGMRERYGSRPAVNTEPGHRFPTTGGNARDREYVWRFVNQTREETPVVTMYSTQWCTYCRRLKSQMDREGIEYQVVDIEDDPEAAEYVMSVNGGNQTVPTVTFEDGSAMTNPTIVQVREKLAAASA